MSSEMCTDKPTRESAKCSSRVEVVIKEEEETPKRCE